MLVRSQAWPFPDSFMIAFKAEYLSGDIILDDEEMEDARWFNVDVLPKLPESASISRKLINFVLDEIAMMGEIMMDTIEELLSTNEIYKHSRQDIWEKRSSIRTRPRRFVSEDDLSEREIYFFPLSRQPLCIHPLILKLGEKARKYILTQSAFKFMMDVAVLETEVVNAGALLVANNKLRFDFPHNLRHDALSVIIDEAYHAYVAIDFMKQVEILTGIKTLSMPNETAVIQAIHTIQKSIDPDYSDLFFLMAVCIGEHVLTKDLISIGKDKTICKTFSDVMADHVLDEGRHANIFAEIMTWVWERMSEEEKDTIGQILPEFMRLYLKSDIQQAFDQDVLQALELSDSDVAQIMSDTYISFCSTKLDAENPVIKNLMTMLNRCRVLEHEKTNKAFQQAITQ